MMEHHSNTKKELEAMEDKTLFNDFKRLTEKQSLGVKTCFKEPTATDVADWTDFYLKKLVPTLNANDFIHFRNEIERLVENGYRFKRVTQEERESLLNPKVTQLELDYYAIMTELGEHIDDPSLR